MENLGDNDTILQFKRRITKPGLYFITVDDLERLDNGTTIPHSDTISILVESLQQFDAKLQGKWGGMKNKLGAKNAADALKNISANSRELYGQIYTDLADKLPTIIANMQEIQLIYVHENVSKYRIRRVQNIDGENVTITYYIYFVKDADGIWRIESW